MPDGRFGLRTEAWPLGPMAWMHGTATCRIRWNCRDPADCTGTHSADNSAHTPLSGGPWLRNPGWKLQGAGRKEAVTVTS